MKHSRKKAGMRPAQAQRHMDALAEGGMRPALYYTNQGQAAGPQGVVEAPHTVAHRVKSKEEFPGLTPQTAPPQRRTQKTEGRATPLAARPLCFIYRLSPAMLQAAPPRRPLPAGRGQRHL